MTLRAFGRPCSLPTDGVVTPPIGKPPGPGPSGGHEKHPGLAAARLTFVFQRSALSLCFGLLTCGLAGATDHIATPSPEPASPGARDDNLATVLLQVEISQTLLRQVRQDIHNAQEDVTQTVDVGTIEATLDSARQRQSGPHQAESSLVQLMELETRLAGHADQLHQEIEALTRSIGQLESDLDRLNAESQRWIALLAIANARASPALLLEQAQRVTADLTAQQSAVYPVRNRRLEQLAHKMSLQLALNETTDQLLAQREGMANMLRESERDPLWRVAPLQPGTIEAAHKALGTWISGIAGYLHTKGAAVITLAVLLMLLTQWLLRQAGSFLQENPLAPPISLDAERIIERPLWAMGFVALLGLNFAPKGPIAYYDLLWLMLLLPSVVLTQHIRGPRHGLSITALGGMLAVFPFRTILEAFPAIDRWVLALQAIVLATALVLDGHQCKSARSGVPLPAWRPLLAVGIIAGLSISLILNLIGLAGYARVLVDGLLGTLGFVMVYTTARVVVFALILGVQQSCLGQFSRAIRTHPLEFALVMHRGLGWITLGMIVFGGLYAFRIQDEARILGVQLWQASLPLGTSALSMKSVISALLWLVGTGLLIRITRWMLEEEVFPRLRLPSGVPFAITTVVRYTLAMVGVVLSLLTLGIDVSKVTLLAGALSVGIGFGLQNIVNNFFSGLILLFERPIHRGDVIEVGKLRGTVTKMGIRSSLIKTSEGAEVIVPNANLISKEVINWTLSDRRLRIEIPVMVARGEEEEAVLSILLAVAKESDEVLAAPAPEAILRDTSAESLDFLLACWIPRYEDQRRIASQLRIAINHKFSKRAN